MKLWIWEGIEILSRQMAGCMELGWLHLLECRYRRRLRRNASTISYNMDWIAERDDALTSRVGCDVSVPRFRIFLIFYGWQRGKIVKHFELIYFFFFNASTLHATTITIWTPELQKAYCHTLTIKMVLKVRSSTLIHSFKSQRLYWQLVKILVKTSKTLFNNDQPR